MSYRTVTEELKLKYCAFGVSRVNEEKKDQPSFRCIISIFDEVVKNGTLYLTPENIGCRGGVVGLGLSDDVPDIPGGFGNFIAGGKGKGFPSGERIKCCPHVAEKMLSSQPQNVMNGFNAIKIEPYNEKCSYDLVVLLGNPDQMSGFLHLFYYRRSTYDNVIVPIASGCAQMFRIPFGEIGKDDPKAVIGNIDFFSRPHLDKDLFSFTVMGKEFERMCEDAPESFLFAPAWNGVKKRL